MATKHRIANLIAILLPFVALFAGVAYLWDWGLTWIHLILLLVMYPVTGFGVTIGYHRLFTHKSFDTGPRTKLALGVLGAMSLQGPIRSWVAFHRLHHQHSDHADDPHTPHARDGDTIGHILQGWWKSHLGWMLVPVDPETYKNYVPDLDRDPVIRFIDRFYWLWAALSLLIPGVIAGVVTQSFMGGLLGVIWGGLVRVLMVQHITWSVNSICHLWGTKPYDNDDESRNNPIVGVLALGEGWHNNHHSFPTSARHGLRWWQFDASYIVIKAMQALGLVTKVKVPTKQRLEAKRAEAKAAAKTSTARKAGETNPGVASAAPAA